MDKENKNNKELFVKFFSQIFTNWHNVKKSQLKLVNKNWIKDDYFIYDIPSIIFLFGDAPIPIYWKFEFNWLINKIIKEVYNWERPETTDITINELERFRRHFYKHYDFQEVFNNIISQYETLSWESNNQLFYFNDILKEFHKLKFFEDFDLSFIRDIRKLFWNNLTNNIVSWDLQQDLFEHLKFWRFDNIEKDLLLETIDKFIVYIKDDEEVNPINYKSLNDRNRFPDDIMEDIERFVLMQFTNNPDTKREASRLNIWKIKQILWFRPRGWQRHNIVFEDRENLYVCSRRAWKSFVLVYKAIRQMFLRNQMILYILPAKEWYSNQPFFYIQKLMANVKDFIEAEEAKSWTQSNKAKAIPWLNLNEKDFKVTYKDTNSKILFISAQGWTQGARSFDANLVLLDEMAYINDQDVYDVAYASTTSCIGRLIWCSTISKDTPINMFFYKKVELEWQDWAYVVTVDLYNNPFISDQEKKKIENKYKNTNKKIWLSEYMWMFITGDDWFDTSNFFKIDFDYEVLKFNDFPFPVKKGINKFTKLVICWDPWRDVDPAGISVIWVKNYTEVEVIMSWYIKVKNYMAQVEAIEEMEDYFSNYAQTEIVIDLWKAGIALYDLFVSKWLMPYWIYNTGEFSVNKSANRIYNMWVKYLESNLQTFISSWVLVWYSWLDWIRNEFDTYTDSKTRKWTKHHHDILSSLMIWLWLLYEKKIISYKKSVQQDYQTAEDITDAFEELINWRKKEQQSNRYSKFIY